MLIYGLLILNALSLGAAICIHFYHLRRESKLIDRLLERSDIVPLGEAPRGRVEEPKPVPRKLRFKLGI